MRDMVFDLEGNSGLTMEWTTGPNIESFPVLPTGEEGLYQDAESILTLFGERFPSRDRKITIVGVNADLSYRAERNLRRPDPMDPDDFAQIFRDGGELRDRHARRFPVGMEFTEYENNFDDGERFVREMRQMCGREVSRLIEGGWANPERQRS